MGTASSVQPQQGMLANPRMVYTENLSKKTKKSLKIDTPVLIDLKHGSIRYRYANDGKSGNISKSTEQPFEGKEKKNKGHYFYHPRLNDFSEKAVVDREDPQKFLYVMKGPNSAKQKKVFYVYGRSWDAQDGQLVKPTQTVAMEKDPNWPIRQNANDVYYNLTFIPIVPVNDPIPGIPNRYQMDYAVKNTDTVFDLKKRIAHCIIKSTINVHVCFEYRLISDHQVISELLLSEETQEALGVHLTIMER